MKLLSKNDCMHIAGGSGNNANDDVWRKIELTREQVLDKKIRSLCFRAETAFGKEMSSLAEFKDCEAILRQDRDALRTKTESAKSYYRGI